MGMYKCPDCLTEWFSGDGGHNCTIEFKKPISKRTISLETYLMMQNNWMIALTVHSEDSAENDFEFCTKMVDSLLEHNGVDKVVSLNRRNNVPKR